MTSGERQQVGPDVESLLPVPPTAPVSGQGEGIYIYDKVASATSTAQVGAMVSNIGHSNPNVLAAMRAQMDKSTFGYRLHFRTDPSEDLAAKTASLMTPAGLDRVFFVSGGSEAVESAIKLARQYASPRPGDSRYKVISRFPSYHGCTLGALALTGYEPLTRAFRSDDARHAQDQRAHHVPRP
jgi:adenosylmethionine-8-amino-7-oxononanoate aminotransferase